MFRFPAGSRLRVWGSAIGACLVAAMATAATSASASPGYELDPVNPSIAVSAETPHGVAVDQESQSLYVTELSTNLMSLAHGQIEKFDSSGAPAAGSPFVTGGTDFFTGVAVNPVTHGVYAYQAQYSTPLGIAGVSKMSIFSSGGVEQSSFAPEKTSGPQIAADSSGRVYYPNDASDTVQVFDSSGSLKETISCTGCAGGAFVDPASVALDSANNLYVVDVGNGRVTKFKLSGGSYAYDSVLQSGQGAAAVGVDPSSGDVLVGDLTGGYHIVAYDSSGVQFDDFGAGVVGPPSFGSVFAAGQIAANATTHKLYVSDSSGRKVWIFDRVSSIPAPVATTEPASSVGQLEATLKGKVDPEGHGLTDCHFEYTTDADFQANGFANATSALCPSKPGGSTAVSMSAHLGSLTPNTSYDYRIVATSNGGTSAGGAQSFTTLPALPPSVTTGSASAPTPTTATIAATVNAHGGPISNCHFEYTTDADFQENAFANAKVVSCAPKPSGTTDVAVSAKLTGLSTNTAYRYRAVATNNAGTSEGADQPFSTPAESCETNPALCPPSPAGGTQSSVSTQTPAPAPSASAPKPLKCRKGFRKKRVRGKLRCVRAKRHQAQR